MEENILELFKKLGNFGAILLLAAGIITFNNNLLKNPILVDSIQHNLQYMLIENNESTNETRKIAPKTGTIVIINAGTKPLDDVTVEIESMTGKLTFSVEGQNNQWETTISGKNHLFNLKNSLMPGFKKRIMFSKSSNYTTRRANVTVSCKQAKGALVKEQKFYNIAVRKHLFSSLFYFNLDIIIYFIFPSLLIFIIYKVFCYRIKNTALSGNNENTQVSENLDN